VVTYFEERPFVCLHEPPSARGEDEGVPSSNGEGAHHEILQHRMSERPSELTNGIPCELIDGAEEAARGVKGM